MPCYFMRIFLKGQSHYDPDIVCDLSKNDLYERYLGPYERGETFAINGRTVQITDIKRFQVYCSEKSSQEIRVLMEARYRDSDFGTCGNPNALEIFDWVEEEDWAEDVTNELVGAAPGNKSDVTKSVSEGKKPKTLSDSRKVFVVHGHDHELKKDLELFLYRNKLIPVVLHREADRGQTVIEKFEAESDEVAYAIILLTPDDMAFPASEKEKADNERSHEYRARQNVIFECGYFMARLKRKKVMCICKKGVAMPSDLAGFVYKEVSESVSEIEAELIQELKEAGLSVERE